MLCEFNGIVCIMLYFATTLFVIIMCLVLLTCATCTASFLVMTWILAYGGDWNERDCKNLQATAMAEIDMYIKIKMRKKAIRWKDITPEQSRPQCILLTY